MENEIGRIRKSDTTETVVRKTEFRGSVGIDIREYVTSERYTGWSKNGIRIPMEQWKSFKEILNKVDDGLQGEEDDQAGDV
ncbi:MAG: transcriptional coactivator p15/PC4 family protein [Methanotrichaceae archaeon]